MLRRVGIMLCGAMMILAGCGSSASIADEPADSATSGTAATTTVVASDGSVAEPVTNEVFPDVLDVKLESEPSGTWTVSATISSPYDSPERYADGFRVMAADGTVLGERVLTHDHASEQPFTRSLNGVAIPVGTESVAVEARDQISGYGGTIMSTPVPG